MSNDYIPDMTERFPEGPRGIDMTDSYFTPSGYNHYEDYDQWVRDNVPEESDDKDGE